jgi:hypothetical protein
MQDFLGEKSVRKTFEFRLIDWCLTPTLAVFQLNRGI